MKERITVGKDKADAIKDLKKTRDSGKFNMFVDRRKILQYANENGYFHLISYCGNDVDKYLELLKEGKLELRKLRLQMSWLNTSFFALQKLYFIMLFVNVIYL